MKIEVVIKHAQTATFDIGDLPVNLVRDLLTVDSIQVTEKPGK